MNSVINRAALIGAMLLYYVQYGRPICVGGLGVFLFSPTVSTHAIHIEGFVSIKEIILDIV